MKLSEIAYKCQINPPRNGFSWKRLTMILTSNIWKGDQKAIAGISKDYTKTELKSLVQTIQSFDKVQLKEFQEELIKINVQVLKERMNIKIYESDTTIGKLFESREADLSLISHNFDKTNESEFDNKSTSLVGTLTTSFNNIVKTFGKPILINDGKSKYQWYIRMVELDTILSIYDWKTPNINKNTEIEWMISGEDSKYVEDYVKILKSHF